MQQFADLQLRSEHGATRGFGGMRSQHELEGHAPGRIAQLRARHAGATQFLERGIEGLGRDASLDGVLTSSPDAMVLLGQVRELEVERERAHQPALLVERQLRDDRLDSLEVA